MPHSATELLFPNLLWPPPLPWADVTSHLILPVGSPGTSDFRQDEERLHIYRGWAWPEGRNTSSLHAWEKLEFTSTSFFTLRAAACVVKCVTKNDHRNVMVIVQEVTHPLL